MVSEGAGLAFVAADEQRPLRDWTVGQLLEHAAEQAPDHVALKVPAIAGDNGLQWTYAELLADSRRLTSFLAEHFRPGENVAIWGSNSATWTLFQLAAAQSSEEHTSELQSLMPISYAVSCLKKQTTITHITHI